jgi:hypothetical protein
MTGFDFLTNYIENTQALIRTTRLKLKKTPALKSEDNHIRRSLPPEFEAMANRTLRELSAPTMASIHTRSIVNVRDNRFELKQRLINMVQANQLCGKAHEDTSAHLQHFLEICITFTIK